MNSSNQDPNFSESSNQSNNNDVQSGPPEKAKAEQSEIFSLDAIDDSWMDEQEEFPGTRIKDIDPEKINRVEAQPQPKPQSPPTETVSPVVSRKNRENYHFFVDGSKSMELHGIYEPLGVSDRNQTEEAKTGTALNDHPERTASPQINPQVEATLMEIDQSQQLQAPDEVQLPGELSVPSQPRGDVPKLEDLLSGNFDSVSSGKFAVQQSEQAPPQSVEDTSPTMSQMIKRDLQLDSLIDEGQSQAAPDEKTKVQEIFSQPQQVNEPPVNSQHREDTATVLTPPPAPEQAPAPKSASKKNSPSRLPRAFSTQASDAPSPQKKPISRKSFSRHESPGRRPFVFIVLAVVLVGVVIGIGLYQFKGAVAPKLSTEKDGESGKSQISSSISAPESPTEAEAETLSSKKENWERDFDRGADSFERKEYQKAIVYFSTSIAEDGGKHAKVFHMRGRSYSRAKKYEQAIEDFSKALKIDPGNEKYLIDRAAAFVHSDESKKALRDYSRILARSPDNLKALYGRALVYYQLDRVAKAKRDFKKVISIEPQNAGAYYYLGMIHHSEDENEEAITCYDKALSLEKRAEIFYERAFVYYAENNLAKTINDLTRAIELKPEKKEYYNDRGFIYLKENRKAEAKADFEMALKLDPEYKVARDNLAKASNR